MALFAEGFEPKTEIKFNETWKITITQLPGATRTLRVSSFCMTGQAIEVETVAILANLR